MGEALKHNKALTVVEMYDHWFYNNVVLVFWGHDIDYNYLGTYFTALEYNTTLQYLGVFIHILNMRDTYPRISNKGYSTHWNTIKSAPKATRRQVKRAGEGKRTAPEKGAYERRAIYNWMLHNNHWYRGWMPDTSSSATDQGELTRSDYLAPIRSTG